MAETHLRLLDLPPELVQKIFTYLSYEQAGKRPICRALLPFTRENLLFDCEDVGSSPDEAAKRLALRVKWLYLNFSSSVVTELLAQQIALGVGLMRNVRTLQVECLPLVSDLLRIGGQGGFPHVASLILGVFRDGARLFDPEQLGQLVSLPSLHSLEISADLEGYDSSSPKAAFPPIPQITDLTLRLWTLFDGIEGVRSLVASLTHLEDFELSFGDEGNPVRILEVLPASLTSLEVQHFEDEDLDLHTEIDAAVPRLSNLTSLTLGGTVFSQSSTFYSLLTSHLPFLEALKIANVDCFRVNSSSLIPFVRARGGRNRSLAHLRVDTCRWFHAGPLPSDNPERPDVNDGSFTFDEENGWRLPIWTEGMNYLDAEDLLDAAEAAGVDLMGTIHPAIGVERSRYEQEYYLELREGGKTHEEAMAVLAEEADEEQEEGQDQQGVNASTE